MSLLRSSRRNGRVLPGVATFATLAASAAVGVPADARAPTAVPDPVVRLAAAPGSVVRSAEVPLARGVERLRTTSYSLVAATWSGPAPEIRVRTAPGRRWQALPVLEDLPDPGSAEGRPGQGATDLLWTGPRTDIEVRVEGDRASDVALVLVDPGELPTDDALVAARPSARAGEEVADRAPRPGLRTRKDWGADNSWRNGKPRYIDKLKQVHLHHTATGNDYRRHDVPGIIRGMYHYHTQSLGWFDIGYNFLVDRFGRTWVGRSGGPARLVQGAHTLGFNHISVGVAVIGNFEEKQPGKDVIRAVTRVAAWKLDRHGRDAQGKVWVRSTGSDKYDDGERVRLPAFDGHRDTNDTACPGQRLYDRLPTLRRRTQRRIDHFS